MQEILVLGKRTPRITDLCESLEQQQVITWANFMRHKYPELELLHHIPNGGKRSKSEAKRFQAEGVKSGVPDLCLPVPRSGYHGLYIEMKKQGGVISKDQSKWLQELSKQGYMVAVCYGSEAAEQMLEDYLAGKYRREEENEKCYAKNGGKQHKV